MILVIGGAYQGKRAYASEKYDIEEKDWTDGENCTEDDILCSRAVYNFHIYIRRQAESGIDMTKLAEKIKKKNPKLIIVTDEVGYGIVPMEAMERTWREACGRVCTVLASYADEVIRISMGIGQKIK
ncbi:MAG: adenosylcobinamide kinase [Clostridia bacterium]|nr:adenosylcobinamide kinase [Clostridia bacterium]NCC44614.1 adenosylcobinamide kinase [Clostridia bacterium]